MGLENVQTSNRTRLRMPKMEASWSGHSNQAANRVRIATTTGIRSGFDPFCCARVRYSQAASAATKAVAAVNSHCQEGGRNTRTRTTGIRTTAVSTRFIGGLSIHAQRAAVL